MEEIDYEKKYKDALGLAKSYYGKDCNEFLDTIFPELRESEDERIRKRLVEYFKGFYDSFSSWNNVHWEGLDVKKVIAYLEKQKEQKPDTRTADDLQLLGFIYDLLASLDWREDYAMSRDECLRRLNDYRPQKPAEWSDTDNIGWDEAFACVTRAEKAAKNEEELQNAVTAEKWLKEIKFKYYVHPVKQEWSEEDEKNCNRIIRFLEPHKTFFPTKETKEEMQNWLKNRLKSLRPQPRWKPSEEQINRLVSIVAALRKDYCDDMADFLASLYEQLKKL